jgi:FkbM family methyltransferase
MNNKINNLIVDYGNGNRHKLKIGWEELEFFYTKQESSTKQHFSKIIKNDWNIIDVGANIGMYSILFANMSQGDLFLIEGSEINSEMLTHNMSDFTQNRENIQIMNVCVGDVDNTLTDSTIHYLWTGRGSVLQKKGDLEFHKIDTLLSNYDKKINLIKIDVDGWDFEALKGCKEIINKSEPLICIELVEETLKINNHRVNDVIEYLKNEHGYTTYMRLDTDNYLFEK